MPRERIDWLKVEADIRTALRLAVEGNNPREALLSIDLTLGDATRRGYEVEGVAPVGWLDGRWVADKAEAFGEGSEDNG